MQRGGGLAAAGAVAVVLQRTAPEARSKAIACAQAMLTCTVEASTAGVPAPLGSSFAQASAPSLPRTAYSVVPEPEPVR